MVSPVKLLLSLLLLMMGTSLASLLWLEPSCFILAVLMTSLDRKNMRFHISHVSKKLLLRVSYSCHTETYTGERQSMIPDGMIVCCVYASWRTVVLL